MASLPPPEAEAETILFRPSKKRKIYRQRAVDDEDEAARSTIAPTTPLPKDPAVAGAQSLDELIATSAGVADGDEVEGTPVSMAEILRLRKLRSKRVGGVEFRADQAGSVREEERGLVVRQAGDGEEGQVEVSSTGVPRKFAPQTGTVGDVNKHMMEYIDSELAKRRRAEGAQTTSSLHSFGTGTNTPNGAVRGAGVGEIKTSTTDVQRQPAALGKLVEIDLGEEARRKNEDRTRRKLGGEEVEDDEKGVKKPPKVRLGRDGKPWRGRKRRASEDVKRDQLVEDVLRENRLEHYEEPIQPPADLNDDQAADDRIAEAFRQEFMDAVAQRRQKKTAPPATASRNAPGKKEEEVLKGPKLGGSRNARAAMRDLMLKQGKK